MFKLGDHVCKIKGSDWHGIIVGTYSTDLTPEGYCVESAFEEGSVQLYPASALEPWDKQSISHRAFLRKWNFPDECKDSIRRATIKLLERNMGPISAYELEYIKDLVAQLESEK